jgi:hypothetical protein
MTCGGWLPRGSRERTLKLDVAGPFMLRRTEEVSLGIRRMVEFAVPPGLLPIWRMADGIRLMDPIKHADAPRRGFACNACI